jgi:hypothetical protein
MLCNVVSLGMKKPQTFALCSAKFGVCFKLQIVEKTYTIFSIISLQLPEQVYKMPLAHIKLRFDVLQEVGFICCVNSNIFLLMMIL